VRGGRELLLLRAGRRLFAVPAEEVEATAEGLVPAPLPFAPPTVLGVVSVRGRVRTALDPLRLTRADKTVDAAHSNSHDATPPHDASANNTNDANDVSDINNTNDTNDVGDTSNTNDVNEVNAARAQTVTTPPRLFVALRGDEQLALACDAAEVSIHVAHARVAPSTDARSPALGTFEHAGSLVTLLDTSRLFEAAMLGTDRRRKRS
jgi:chemotaxis signal transduction protein